MLDCQYRATSRLEPLSSSVCILVSFRFLEEPSAIGTGLNEDDIYVPQSASSESVVMGLFSFSFVLNSDLLC